MLKFYFHPSPNPMKVALLLEELQQPFELVGVDMLKGQQHAEDFRKINPNAKLPAIEDDGQRVFDSHAILLHLAEKSGQYLPATTAGRAEMLSWLMFVASGLSPFSGQAAHFLHYAPEVLPYARNRYLKEVERHYSVLEERLAVSTYLAGEEYTIADMALWGWGISAGYIFGEKGLTDYPNVKRVIDEISQRPAAARAHALKDKLVLKTEFDEESRRALFPQNV
jgi:GST-like protein